MAELDPLSADRAVLNSEPLAANAEAPRAAAEENHAPHPTTSASDPSPQTANSSPDDRAGLDRAELIVDLLAAKVSSVAATWGRQCLRLGSRAREWVQDFWAEVQDFRHGKKP
jgi:hypothetical protein